MDTRDITGLCDVRFVGQEGWSKINVDRIWVNNYGHILYVTAKDGALYNWSNIIVIRKPRG